MKKKAKRSVAWLLIVAMVLSFASVLGACGEESGKHICGHVCEICRKCTSDCTDPVCAEKCEGHEVAHTCGHVCPTCGKCTDAACTDPVCAEKCPGHEAEAHECKHVCEECGKCTDAACADPVCAEKCEGHEDKEFTPVEAPRAGAYYFAMKVDNEYWYITGQMAATYYFGTTKNKDSAVTVDLVADGEGWLIMQGTRYIEIELNGTHVNAVYKASRTAGKHWTWNATEQVFVWDDQYIIGNTGTYTNIGGIYLNQKNSNHFAVLGTFGEQEVVQPDPGSVTLDHTNDMVLLASHANKYMKLNATVQPATAPQDVTWSVSRNTAGITVTETGSIHWTETEGEATVTATATGTDKTASVKVIVDTPHGATQDDPLTVDEAIALMTEDGEVFAGYAADKAQGFYLTGTVGNYKIGSRSDGTQYATFEMSGINGTKLACTSSTFSSVGSADGYTVVLKNVTLYRTGTTYSAGSVQNVAIGVSATPPAVTSITIDFIIVKMVLEW